MVKLQEFIAEEINETTRNKIFQGIIESIYGYRKRLDLIFNKYSIEIDFETNTVTIYDDVFMEDQPITLNIKSFFNAIKSH